MRVLVTGASGFIGSWLVKKLLALEHEVAIVTRYGNVVKNQRLADSWEDLHVIEADIRNVSALWPVNEWQPDIIFHLAAYNHVGDSFVQSEECFDVNAKGTANLLNAAPAYSKFIYMSSSEVYGFQAAVPWSEELSPHPISTYAITKYAGELFCQMMQKIRRNVQIARCFNTFGPWQSTKAIIPQLIRACLRNEIVAITDGKQTREFNYVDDIINGLIKLGFYEKMIEGPVNIGGGQEISIRDLADVIKRVTDSQSEIKIGGLQNRPTEIWRMKADASRAKALLSWEPEVSFERGVALTVDWYRTNMEVTAI